MVILNINDKELKVKFGYRITLQEKLLSKIAKYDVSEEDDNKIDKVEEMLMFLPEILLIGLQKFHKDEYGYNYETGDGKDVQINAMFDLIEQYCDSKDEKEDAVNLYSMLNKELLEDGFLSGLFRQELDKAKTK